MQETSPQKCTEEEAGGGEAVGPSEGFSQGEKLWVHCADLSLLGDHLWNESVSARMTKGSISLVHQDNVKHLIISSS